MFINLRTVVHDIYYQKHSYESLFVIAVRSGDRILEGTRVPALVQTGPGAHPPLNTVGTGSFPLVKRPRCGVDHPPASSAEVTERVQLYTNLPSWFHGSLQEGLCHYLLFMWIITYYESCLNYFVLKHLAFLNNQWNKWEGSSKVNSVNINLTFACPCVIIRFK
jgi:hypothetical protein